VRDSDARPPSSGAPPVPAGHRLLPHTADCIIEAWGPDRPSCTCEALLGLVETFAVPGETAATDVLPLSADSVGDEDALVSLLEDVIYGIDVFAVVPVRFHLAETENGGLAGDMEVVAADAVELTGPVPKAVSYHGLFMGPAEGGWRCRVLVDV